MSPGIHLAQFQNDFSVARLLLEETTVCTEHLNHQIQRDHNATRIKIGKLEPSVDQHIRHLKLTKTRLIRHFITPSKNQQQNTTRSTTAVVVDVLRRI